MFYIFLYIISFLEGFSTLAVEVLAIRNVVSLVGSNIIITSTILGVIILAISLGYYFGGLNSSKLNKEGLIKKISFNLIIASLFYVLISFFLEKMVLSSLLDFLNNYFLAVFITSLLLFLFPVYMATQTIPLISDLLENLKRGEAAGRVLFFSTVGSFLGSIVPVLFMLPFFGLKISIIIIGGTIFLSGFFLYLFYFNYLRFIHFVLISLFLSFVINTDFNDKNVVYSGYTPYNNIKIYKTGDNRILSLNGNSSSFWDPEKRKSKFSYINEATKLVKKKKPSKVLIIGAGGFSFPQQLSKYDFIKDIDVVDIDKSLYNIAENKFLKENISKKIDFFSLPGRYFLGKAIKNNKNYDFIFVDAYKSKLQIPNQLLTKEFFEDVFSISKNVVFNFCIDDGMNSDFSKSLKKTILSVKKDIYYINESPSKTQFVNYIVSSLKNDGYSKLKDKGGEIIYDNKNSLDYKKYKAFYENQTK